jgi:hypothetical protein
MIFVSGDKLAGGLLPHTMPSATIATAAAAAAGATTTFVIPGTGRSAVSHVTKGYRKLEQDDDRASTASESDDEEAGGSRTGSGEEQHENDSDNEDLGSDFGTNLERN